MHKTQCLSLVREPQWEMMRELALRRQVVAPTRTQAPPIFRREFGCGSSIERARNFTIKKAPACAGASEKTNEVYFVVITSGAA